MWASEGDRGLRSQQSVRPRQGWDAALGGREAESVKVLVQLFAIRWTVAFTGSSVHGILQARTLEWVAIPCSRVPTQGLNSGLLRCRQILYRLSHRGSPQREAEYDGKDQLGAGAAGAAWKSLREPGRSKELAGPDPAREVRAFGTQETLS